MVKDRHNDANLDFLKDEIIAEARNLIRVAKQMGKEESIKDQAPYSSLIKALEAYDQEVEPN